MQIRSTTTINANLDQLILVISPEELNLIFKYNLFNFSPDQFDRKFTTEIPDQIELAILGPPQSDEEDLQGDGFKNYQICYIKLGDIVHETFLNLIEDFDSLDSYNNAIKKFALKVMETEANAVFKNESFDDLKSLPSNSKVLFETIKKNAFNLINDLFDHHTSDSFLDQVAHYLKTKNISFKLSKNAFFYSISSKESKWNVEINVNESNRSISLYSSVVLETASQEHFHVILENINNLNLSIPTGNYEYSNELKMLYFKIHSFLTDDVAYLELENLILESETRIQSILPFLSNITIQSESN